VSVADAGCVIEFEAAARSKMRIYSQLVVTGSIEMVLALRNSQVSGDVA
jgi:hypothetical protein